jgi:hypothetical protein
MESIFRRSLCKTGFVQNPKRRKSFLKYCVLNGKFRKKQNYVLSRSQKTVQKPADFCILLTPKRSTLWGKVDHSADGKKLFLQPTCFAPLRPLRGKVQRQQSRQSAAQSASAKRGGALRASKCVHHASASKSGGPKCSKAGGYTLCSGAPLSRLLRWRTASKAGGLGWIKKVKEIKKEKEILSIVFCTCFYLLYTALPCFDPKGVICSTLWSKAGGAVWSACTLCSGAEQFKSAER